MIDSLMFSVALIAPLLLQNATAPTSSRPAKPDRAALEIQFA